MPASARVHGNTDTLDIAPKDIENVTAAIADEIESYRTASKLRRWGGGLVTFIWVATAICVATKTDPIFFSLKLSEMGDFLAGVFAPVAFLWLILGYSQQADELRMTRNEVRRQAAALETNNTQQSILASTAKETHIQDMEDRQRRNKLTKVQAQPFFRDLKGSLNNHGNGNSDDAVLVFSVTNIGKSCRDFYVEVLSGPSVEVASPSIHKPVAQIKSNASQNIDLKVPKATLSQTYDLKLKLSYRDELNENSAAIVTVNVEGWTAVRFPIVGIEEEFVFELGK